MEKYVSEWLRGITDSRKHPTYQTNVKQWGTTSYKQTRSATKTNVGALYKVNAIP